MPKCHLASTSRPPHVHILTSHAPLHLHHSKSPYIHLMCIFSPCVLPSTSTTQSHLISTSHAYSHLVCSPPHPPLKVTLCPPRMHILTSHIYCSPPPKIICLTSCGKNSQKSHVATPIPSIRYLLRATNYRKTRMTLNLAIPQLPQKVRFVKSLGELRVLYTGDCVLAWWLLVEVLARWVQLEIVATDPVELF